MGKMKVFESGTQQIPVRQGLGAGGSKFSLPEFEIVKEVFSKIIQNKFYSKKFKDLPFNSWNDFYCLPFTTKEELRRINTYDLLTVPLSEVWHYHESFGTTGTPISTWLTNEDMDNEVLLTKRWTEPIKSGTIVLNRFPYSLAVPPFIIENSCRKNGGVIIPVGYLSWNISYKRVLDIIKRLNVQVIACLPTEMIILESVLKKCGYEIEKDFNSVKSILVTGRIVPPALKDYIENKWNAKLSNVFGSTETGGIASSCKYGNLHIHPNTFIIEILDPEKLVPVKNGEIGLLVVTSYYRKASPLFRYITGDFCRINTTICHCGDKNPVIEVFGRKEDIINFDGKRLFLYDIEQPVLEFSKQFDSAVYFFIITKNGLTIRIETNNRNTKPTLESLDLLKSKIPIPVKIKICKQGELLDVNFLMRTPEVYKPKSFSDWRTNKRKTINMTEGLISFPSIGLLEFIDIFRRFFKNAILKKVLK